MQIKSLFTVAILPIALTLGACSGGSTGAGDVDAVGAREDIMKNWKDAMGIMGGMVKAPDTFDAAVFKEQAKFLADDADSPWVHFADKANMGEATEAVWSNPDEFQAEIANFKQATSALNSVAQTATSVDEVKEAFGAVGASCQSCHDDFKGD